MLVIIQKGRKTRSLSNRVSLILDSKSIVESSCYVRVYAFNHYSTRFPFNDFCKLFDIFYVFIVNLGDNESFPHIGVFFNHTIVKRGYFYSIFY